MFLVRTSPNEYKLIRRGTDSDRARFIGEGYDVYNFVEVLDVVTLQKVRIAAGTATTENVIIDGTIENDPGV